MREEIRQAAFAAGFDQCRFTSAEPPASAGRFRAWLDAGHHGDMAWIARNAEKRVDPQAVLPGAASVVVLAAAHPAQPAAPVSKRVEAGGEGVVARYARGADYHTVLEAPLRRLTQCIQALGGPETRSLWYVDTGPILERDLAQRAGIGFVGKHTGLISRELGNWFLLAEILTTLPLEPDTPQTNRCGSCTRCLQACPTGAIPAPFTLDARRCISYLTIELKGPIPEPLRPAIGTRIFGCDDCLAVCPWNRFAREGRLLRHPGRPELEHPNLRSLLAIDEAGFRRLFGETPIARIKRRGLRRNVCVALGNRAEASTLPDLERAAADPEPLVAEHARWAIARTLDRTRPAGGAHRQAEGATDPLK